MTWISLWSEGWQATGGSSDATFHGKFEVTTLREAAEIYKNSIENEHSRDCIDLEHMTYWGCRFFDNEEDARKSFG